MMKIKKKQEEEEKAAFEARVKLKYDEMENVMKRGRAKRVEDVEEKLAELKEVVGVWVFEFFAEIVFTLCMPVLYYYPCGII